MPLIEKPIEALILLMLLALAFIAGLLTAPFIVLGIIFPPLLIIPLIVLSPVLAATIIWILWMMLKP